MINYESPAREEEEGRAERRGERGGGSGLASSFHALRRKNQKGDAASLKSTGIELEKLVVKPFCVGCFQADTKRAVKRRQIKGPAGRKIRSRNV